MRNFVEAVIVCLAAVLSIMLLGFILAAGVNPQFPSVIPFYQIGSNEWIGTVRVIGGVIASVCLFLSAVFVLVSIQWRTIKSQLVHLTAAAMLLASSTNLLTITLLIKFGGIWHAVGAFTAIIDALTLMVGLGIFIWGTFALAKRHADK